MKKTVIVLLFGIFFSFPVSNVIGIERYEDTVYLDNWTLSSVQIFTMIDLMEGEVICSLHCRN